MSKLDRLRAEFDQAQVDLTEAQAAYREAVCGLRLVEKTKDDIAHVEGLQAAILHLAQLLRSKEREVLKCEQNARPDPLPTIEDLSPQAQALGKQIQATVDEVIQLGVETIGEPRLFEEPRGAPYLVARFGHQSEDLKKVTHFGGLLRDYTCAIGLPVRTPADQVPELKELWDRTFALYEEVEEVAA